LKVITFEFQRIAQLKHCVLLHGTLIDNLVVNKKSNLKITSRLYSWFTTNTVDFLSLKDFVLEPLCLLLLLSIAYLK